MFLNFLIHHSKLSEKIIGQVSSSFTDGGESFRSWLYASLVKKLPACYELGIALPYLLEADTSPCSEPDKFNPHPSCFTKM
jgi:hypothetical protein